MMQALPIISSLIPALPTPSGGGLGVAPGATSSGSSPSAQLSDASGDEPSFSRLLDRASQGESPAPKPPGTGPSATRSPGPKEPPAATPKEASADDTSAQVDSSSSKSAAPQDKKTEDSVDETSAAQVINAPEMARLLNQLMPGGQAPPANGSGHAAQAGRDGQFQAKDGSKLASKGMATANESRTVTTSVADSAARKGLSRPADPDAPVSSEAPRVTASVSSGSSLSMDAPSIAKAVEGKAQQTSTALPPVISNLLAQANSGAGSPAAMNAGVGAPVVDTAIPHQVQHDEFMPALSARIATLVRDGVEEARLHLNPAEMGPVALKLSLDAQQVRVDMTADLAATRQILEQAMPTLAGALREAGFTLTGGGVFQPADESSGRSRAGSGSADPGAGQPNPDGSGAWASASGQPSDGRRPQDHAAGSTLRAPADLGLESGVGTDGAMNLTMQLGAEGTVRWPAGTRLVDMFA